jgi:hypothetical protein
LCRRCGAVIITRLVFFAVPHDVSGPDSLPPFPELFDEPLESWRWPAPPFEWAHSPPPDAGTPQPCRIETASGAALDGAMLGFDPAARTLRLRTRADGPSLELPFSRFRRLTLIVPLRASAPLGGGTPERVPAATQEREVLLQQADGTSTQGGRTLGHVQADEGLYLFAPVDSDPHTLLRVFVPRHAYSGCSFGATARERVAERWIATPQDLLHALAEQQRRPVRRIGHSLLELGLVTPEQLERALASQRPDKPLGETLVAQGLITHADLHTAIAHKMGYPIVDLTRFPVDRAAAARLPLRLALGHRALPIMVDGERLIVAMDRPSRAVKLQALHGLQPFTLVPVLAAKTQILSALAELGPQDGWSQNVALRTGFFATTL